jgi:hypothetical protein
LLSPKDGAVRRNRPHRAQSGSEYARTDHRGVREQRDVPDEDKFVAAISFALLTAFTPLLSIAAKPQLD